MNSIAGPAPTDEETPENFYRKTHPWGFWKRVCKKVLADNSNFKKNTNFVRDFANIVVGIVWQTCLVAAPIYLVCKEFTFAGTGLMIIIVCSIILYTNWYKKFED
ncbi:MAG: hypothetical protein LBR64_01385 [Dysgonamonadaceae bacterium]|nr:hypothetical protein [Dysgonamonadaceae bacterium]